MKLTTTIKLLPTPEQADALKRTLQVANAACNHISMVAWEARTFGKFDLQQEVYDSVREQYGLGAQMTIRCIAKVTHSYKLDKATPRTFKPLGAIAYDDRILNFRRADSTVSIWTLDGRLTIPFVCGERQRAQLATQKGESDLVYRKGQFYLYPTFEAQEAPMQEAITYLGVDLGIKNIAADNDEKRYSGAEVNGLRRRHARLRSRLQAKGTKSARKLLRKRSKKENRFAGDVNHQIAKEIVERAKGTQRGIALEDLTGIRERITVRKAQRSERHSWRFYDLRLKIVYKARLAGVPVVLVDPRNTSRECPACGHIDKANRPSQSKFCCVACGCSGHADTIAAVNIARRAALVNQPYVSDAPHGA